MEAGCGGVFGAGAVAGDDDGGFVFFFEESAFAASNEKLFAFVSWF